MARSVSAEMVLAELQRKKKFQHTNLLKIFMNLQNIYIDINVLPDYLKYSLLDFRTAHDSQKLPVKCRSKFSIPRQERICTKFRKETWVLNFTSYLNVMVLKNLEYQLYQNTIELDVAL